MKKILLAALVVGSAWGTFSCTANKFCRASLPPQPHLQAPETTPRYHFRHGPREVRRSAPVTPNQTSPQRD